MGVRAFRTDEKRSLNSILSCHRAGRPAETDALFDTPGFVRNLERAYKPMWEVFQQGAPPRQLAVTEKL